MMSPLETQKNDAINAQYELYKQQRAEKEAKNAAAAKLQAEEKAARNATWAQKKKHAIVTTRKEAICHGCGAIIPKGTKCYAPSELTNISSRGYTMVLLTRHYCQICRPVKEA